MNEIHCPPAQSAVAAPHDATPSCANPALLALDATAAVAAMRSGEIKAEDYAHALLAHADRQRELNAFCALDRQQVLAAARAADLARAAGGSLGPLHGLPVAVKDSVNTRALPTSNGTPALRDFTPASNAPVVDALLDAGALLLGKTNLHELSFGWTTNNALWGPARNPSAPAHIAGGSSGGSAAAVAAGIAPLAVAEDTLGSLRTPAALCGIAGLRPSFGRYPNTGVATLTDDKFDQVGPLARTVRDLVLFDSVLMGVPGDLRAAPLHEIRIGIFTNGFFDGLDIEVERITEEALYRLQSAGATLVPLALPASLGEAMNVASTVVQYESAVMLTEFLERHGAAVTLEDLLREAGDLTRAAFTAFCMGMNRPAHSAYVEALARIQSMRGAIRQLFHEHALDACALPPVLGAAPRIGEDVQVKVRGADVPLNVFMTRNIALGTCAGMPGLVLPAGRTARGLPVGIELDMLPGRDRALLSLGLAAEAVLDVKVSVTSA
jgi:Asp-tRNA(Asn)/Glu-tRNA(Gln) amidotransferase A subunit family amidase